MAAWRSRVRVTRRPSVPHPPAGPPGMPGPAGSCSCPAASCSAEPGGGRVARGWWNGLLYSWYQLLVCPELDSLLALLKGWRTSCGTVIARVPDPGRILLDRAVRLRTMAVVLTALETRYLPVLDPEWLQLINADRDEWQRY